MIGEPKQEKTREKEIFQEDGSLYIGEGLENYYIDQLTRTNKYAVFPLDVNGIPDLTKYKGVEMQGYYWDDSTDSEIVEKLGKDYLLNLIKEKENG